MLYVYQVQVEDDAAVTRLCLDFPALEGVEVETAYSFGQGPAYLVVASGRELTAQELELPEGRELVLVHSLTDDDLADAALASLTQQVDAELARLGVDQALSVELSDGEPE